MKNERNRQPYDNVLETIGWTPLIKLNQVTRGIRTPVYAKAEFFNPGGSVKDRIGLPIIERAEKEGKLKPGGTIVEGTSGNTGVGLAIAAALRGYKCIFTMPDKMSQEKVRLLKAFGAEVIVTPTAVPPDHPDNYVMMARRIAKETPNAILADQFYNDANPDAHYATTGPEIWQQTSGKITHFVGSAGTGGTLTGVGRYLKERSKKVRVIAGDPAGSILAEYWRSKGKNKIEGTPYKVEGIGQDKLPGTLDMSVIDEYYTVSDKESFANAMVVTILCDTGERYLSKLYSDEWMRENQMLDVPKVALHSVLGRKNGGAPAVVSVGPGATVRQAIGLMSLHDVSQLPVMDGANCVGSVSDWSVSQKSLENPKLLDLTVSEIMDSPFPMVASDQPVDSVVKLLSKANPAVLVQEHGVVQGIVTRSDMLHYMMSR
jgi:cystathionine beta-synthase